jgi:hypothetical protein
MNPECFPDQGLQEQMPVNAWSLFRHIYFQFQNISSDFNLKENLIISCF